MKISISAAFLALALVATLPSKLLGTELERQAPSPEGWRIASVRLKGSELPVCQGDGPEAGDAQLSIATEGPQLLLMVRSPSMPRAKGDYRLSLSINDGPVVPLNAIGGESTIAVPITRELADALTVAVKVKAQVGAEAYQFQVRNAGAAMDAVSRCAGMPTWADVRAHAPTPIPGAGGWTLVTPGPGQPKCSIRINGPEVDTNIILNNLGNILLAPGRPDWAAWPGERDVLLGIDDWPAEKVKAGAINTIVVVSLNDDEMAERLKKARTLHWQMPTGTFTADVQGIGPAIEALTNCEKARQASRK